MNVQNSVGYAYVLGRSFQELGHYLFRHGTYCTDSAIIGSC
jgi:hypothetical protein